MNRIALLFWLICVSVPLALSFQTVPASAGGEEVVVVRVQGTVLVEMAGGGKWTAAHRWMKIPLKGRIKTLSGASADLLLKGRTLIRIKEGAELEIDHLDRELSQLLKRREFRKIKGGGGKGTLLRLLDGRALLLVSPEFEGLPLIVDTPIGMAGVSGTRFVVDLTSPGECALAVWEGGVLFWNKRHPEVHVLVSPGEISTLTAVTTPTTPSQMNPGEKKRYQEIEELHLWKMHEKVARDPGSKYRGRFSRGYSPSSSDMSGMVSQSEGAMSPSSCDTGMEGTSGMGSTTKTYRNDTSSATGTSMNHDHMK